MKQECRDAFLPFTKPLEGVVAFMYCDVKGLVTTAIGNLIDSPADALSCPWLRKDGTRATKDEIVAEWTRIKARQDLRMRGGMAYQKIATLHLDDEGIAFVVGRTLDRMDHELAKRFAGWESFPWQAQLATLSMSWACGTGFRFPRLAAALNARDFTAAASECHIDETGNPGVVPRNVKNKALYLEAAGPVAPELSTVAGQQAALVKLGYDPGPADGVRGPKTVAAVVAFQLASKLTADGVVGPRTLAALAKALPQSP